MSTPDSPSECAPADRLYRTLTAAHSRLAAALMTAAVTGRWPFENVYRAAVLARPE
ncbi:hypothetical protein [Nocardia sp. NPDC006630]|uniref:hypothetical protein n=1 Tax=Nocardia sp. NPDC006630 TaxID=3157181 RepID=UPI0033A5E9A5